MDPLDNTSPPHSPSPPLRVALVTETFPPEVNGVAMTLGRLTAGLLQQGHCVQLVRPSQGASDEDDTGVASAVGLEQVLVRGISIPNYTDLQFGLPAARRLRKLWLQQRPDVVHVATEGPLGWSAVSAARQIGLPVTSSFHTNFHSYSKHYGMGLLKAPIEHYLRRLHNKTQATLVPTPTLARDLQERGYQNVAVMSRGVAIAQFTAARRSQALRARWGASEDTVVVLYVGRLAKEKSVGTVITAFHAIQERVPSAKLVLVGDGPLRIALQESCPRAVFAGVCTGTELAEYYASSDLFLFPSLTETFGNVVPEAMASGLAVVSYDLAAAAGLITHNHNGLLITPGDALSFINAAAKLATDAPRLRALRQRAAPSVEHLDWSAVVDSFVRTLRTVIEIHHGENVQSAHLLSFPGYGFNSILNNGALNNGALNTTPQLSPPSA